MCSVYIKCYMILLGLKLPYTGVIVAIVTGAKVNQCMCCVYIRMVVWVYVKHMSVDAVVAAASVQ